ncbi:hypothetical protein B6D20_13305, partial [Gilliamella apicola]
VYTVLYQQNAIFKRHVDSLSEKFQHYLGEDVRCILFPDQDHLYDALEKASETKWSQPALFILSSGLFKILQGYGVKPDYLLGHSLGELIAAYVGGIFSEDDAIKCIANRALLMNDTPEGKMLIVFANHEIFHVLPEKIQDKLSVAAINTSTQFVLSGQSSYIEEATQFLNEININSKLLAVSKAFHSELMDDILPSWDNVLKTIEFNESKIPLVSNLTGEILSDKSSITDAYWIKHLRNTVRFEEGVNRIVEDIVDQGAKPVFVELSAAKSLSTLSLMNCAEIESVSLGRPNNSAKNNVIDQSCILNAIGQLWSLGCHLDLASVIQKSYVIELPVAKLNPESYWIKPDDVRIQDFSSVKVSTQASHDSSEAKLFSKMELEDLSLRIWKKIILNEQITINDDFFLLGGDSLQALEITREFKAYGIPVSLADIMTYSTIKQLADFIFSNQNKVSENSSPLNKNKLDRQTINEEDLSQIIKQLNLD